jgi:hypothetical protein
MNSFMICLRQRKTKIAYMNSKAGQPTSPIHSATAIPLPITITLPSYHPLRCRFPLLLLLSITNLPPPSIVIAAAVHLTPPTITLLLHQRQSSAAHCTIYCTAAVPSPIVIASPSWRP